MKLKNILLGAIVACASLIACSDDDSFTLSTSHRLTFSADTIRMDTVFSNVPSATRSFWVYNRSGDGLRCTDIRLAKGNQTGFRVNVDGTYLGPSLGYHTSNVELRNKDSIRVFVELTSPYNQSSAFQFLEDNLVFTLESGVEQRVNLNAYSWEARQLSNIRVTKDSTLAADGMPVIIYGGITVDAAATLTIPAGTTLYFHADAGIDVYGRLMAEGKPGANVTMRGSRIDRMFDYLPYDNVSGQWKGIRFHSSSYGNQLNYTDVHSAFDGIVVDSSDVGRNKLILDNTTIHNCQGYGLRSVNSRISLTNCQITNTLNNCLFVDGGWAELNGCTIAQFYPFDAKRGEALRFEAVRHPLLMFSCANTLVTGYADDEVMGEHKDSISQYVYEFDHCILRTPAVENDDSVRFHGVTFEDVKDTLTTGRKHFVKIDTQNLRYDFRLDSISQAVSKANPASVPSSDRDGRPRDELPDIGAFEYYKE